MATLTILQAILGVILHNNKTVEEAFAFFNVNTREGVISLGSNIQKIMWVRGEETRPYYKLDKKGRLFVARKLMDICSWGINSNSGKLVIKPVIIQMNVLKSNSKRGGWLIRLHVQTPILARTKKFQFHGKWVGYWASDAMLEAGLMAKASNNKFGKALLIKDVVNHAYVIEQVNMLKEKMGIKLSNGLISLEEPY